MGIHLICIAGHLNLLRFIWDALAGRVKMNMGFVVYMDGKLLIILSGFISPFPETNRVLDWYAMEYGFDRHRLSGFFIPLVQLPPMKYEDFAVTSNPTKS